MKQVAISSGQILVAKGNPSVSKVIGGKQVVAQGVAKAIVSGAAGSIVGQQVVAKATGAAGGTGKSGGEGHFPFVRSHAYKHWEKAPVYLRHADT